MLDPPIPKAHLEIFSKNAARLRILQQAYKLCCRPSLAIADASEATDDPDATPKTPPGLERLAPLQKVSVLLEALEGGARCRWVDSRPESESETATVALLIQPLADIVIDEEVDLASMPPAVLRVIARTAARYNHTKLFATIAWHAADDEFKGWAPEAIAELELLECMLELQVCSMACPLFCFM